MNVLPARLFFSFALLISLATSTALAEQNAPKFDWRQVLDSCDSNWPKYNNDLNKVRTELKREIDNLSQDQFLKRFVKDDPMILFVRVHWPTLFSGKDTGWMLYQGCAEKNMKARNLLNSPTPTRQERKEKIDDFERCLRAVFAPQGPLPPVYNRMLACYHKHNQ